uniref:Transmembrane protein n=1 Tax=Glypta fumiferanae TaxID=389681 RepID=A0A0F6Q779_9HYME|nr:hypothetical protein [Glypta fumiferanae]
MEADIEETEEERRESTVRVSLTFSRLSRDTSFSLFFTFILSSLAQISPVSSIFFWFFRPYAVRELRREFTLSSCRQSVSWFNRGSLCSDPTRTRARGNVFQAFCLYLTKNAA